MDKMKVKGVFRYNSEYIIELYKARTKMITEFGEISKEIGKNGNFPEPGKELERQKAS
ncbi:hypothetical protein GINT2_001045 [Glugoides intestinalis]